MKPMTPKEMDIEWKYRYEERLGILCGASVPTELENEIATTKANEWRKTYIESITEKTLL